MRRKTICAGIVGGLAALMLSASAALAQTFEIVRELSAPQYFFSDLGPTLAAYAYDVLAFPGPPDVDFAISDYDTVELRLRAPAGMKFVVSDAAQFTWPADIALAPIGSGSGALSVAPASVSFTTLAGTALGRIEALIRDNQRILLEAWRCHHGA